MCLTTKYQDVHEKLGHVGENTIRQTLKATEGLQLSEAEFKAGRPPW